MLSKNIAPEMNQKVPTEILKVTRNAGQTFTHSLWNFSQRTHVRIHILQEEL